MRRITLGILGAVGIASIASAADLPVKAPIMPVAPVYSWTGFYVGGHVGALWTKGVSHWDPLPNAPFFGVFPNSGNLNNTAFVGGVHAGYNWQVSPSSVVGIEADWSWTDANRNSTRPWLSVLSAVGLRPTALTTMSMGPEWLATVRGRFGHLITPSALLYVTGGGAWADVEYLASANNEPDRPSTSRYLSSASFSKTVSGYVLGGGLEWALWNNWSLRGEYLYYHLNTSRRVVASDSTGNFSQPNEPIPLQSGFTWSDTNIHTVRFGASYKF